MLSKVQLHDATCSMLCEAPGIFIAVFTALDSSGFCSSGDSRVIQAIRFSTTGKVKVQTMWTSHSWFDLRCVEMMSYPVTGIRIGIHSTLDTFATASSLLGFSMTTQCSANVHELFVFDRRTLRLLGSTQLRVTEDAQFAHDATPSRLLFGYECDPSVNVIVDGIRHSKELRLRRACTVE
jgi:hypothetical protein